MLMRIIHEDCLVAMRALLVEGVKVHSVVCDPPYGLEFMGKEWDGSDGFRRSLNAADAGRENVFGRQSKRGPEYRTAGAGRKSKPGIGERNTEWVSNQGWNQFRCATCGHLFHGGSPCQCVEPKPSRADNRWNLFQKWCESWAALAYELLLPGGHLAAFGGSRTYHRLACAVEDAGFEIRDQIQWIYGSGFPKSKNDGEGRGTALKPASEPIVLARKPLVGIVAANFAVYGTGYLNIDEARLDCGRWPANVVHDGSAEVLEAFPNAPGQQARVKGTEPSSPTLNIFGTRQRVPFNGRVGEASAAKRYAENGSTNFAALPGARRFDGGPAARFFYHAKASKADRMGFTHPTIKPVNLMRWLVRLVTPVDGIVLDPFAGTGTTGAAALAESRGAILIEREPAYVENIRMRLNLPQLPNQ
jgi:site-specific DNA-methyltransferase (adenine-specific)